MSTNPDERMLAKIRGLLANAEDPTLTDGARQNYMAKAAELMSRHNLAEAVVRAQRGQAPDPIESWVLSVPGTGGHGKARGNALGVIAEAYGCRCVLRNATTDKQPTTVTIVGTRSTLAALRILIPHLSAQMEQATITATKARVTEWKQFGLGARAIRTQRRAYIRAFLIGYGNQVADKIRDREQTITDESKGTGAELVLADASSRVAADFARRFPDLRPLARDRNFSQIGYSDGTVEGRRADLGDPTLSNRHQAAGELGAGRD